MPKPRAPYSAEIAAVIVAGLRAGHGLRALCRGPGMPTRATVMRWLKERPAFARRVRLARARGGLDSPGRPTGCTPALVRQIFLRLCAGEPLRDICRAPDMPSRSTVQVWAGRDPDIGALIDVGRQIGIDLEADRQFEARGGWDAIWALEAKGR